MAVRLSDQATSGVSDLSWSQDSKYLCSASDDKTLKIWDVAAQQCLKTLVGHKNVVMCCSFSPQSNQIVSGSFDDTLRLWDVRSGTCLRNMAAHSDPVLSACYNKDGSMIVSGSADGLVRLWDTSTAMCLKSLQLPTEGTEGLVPVTSVKFTPNGRFLLVSSANSTMRLWNYQNAKVMKTYTGHVNTTHPIQPCFSTVKGKWIITGSEDHAIYVYCLQSRNVAQRLEGHTGPVTAVDAHPTLQMIASCSLDSTVKIWADES